MLNNERKKVWSQAFERGVKEKDSAVASISKELNISEILAILLYNRGYQTAAEAKKFICYETANLHDPYLLNDMDLAVERIEKSLKNNERIYIYGDYDVDGVTSASMLYLYLKSLGADVDIKIPKRDTEGYGISCEAVKLMSEENTKLIVTVDTGITAADEIVFAASLGIDVVITDHHKCRSELPPAVAVINPHREDSTYPFCELAGVGVAFKLICALEMHVCSEKGVPAIDGIRRVCHEYADLAAIGTIADVMPLVDENRLIVSMGLKQIMNTKRRGLAALIDAASSNKSSGDAQNIKKKKITSSFIGYGIAPRINAAGRISDAMIAVRLLLCDNDEEAQKAAEELCEINYMRQQEENRIAEKAYAMIEEQCLAKKNKVIVLADNLWQQGIVGIVSSRITEKYGLPSILISFATSYEGEELGTDLGKGSGRSIKGMNLVEALANCEDCLVKYGGHELAAGLTIQRSQVEEFKKCINEYASKVLSDDDFKISYYADCEIDMKDVTMSLAQDLSLLEPYGVGNSTPTFTMRDVTVARVISIGGGKHTKLLLQKDGISLYAMYFGVASSVLGFDVGDSIDILFNVDINEFRNVRSVQLILEDAHISHSFVKMMDEQKNRYKEIRNGAKYLETENVIPSREDFVQVYTALRKEYRSGRSIIDSNDLMKLLSTSDGSVINYIKLMYIIEILNEMKICRIENITEDIFKFEIYFNASKTNIEKSSILKKLKSQCSDRSKF